jgi:hypothetical protein
MKLYTSGSNADGIQNSPEAAYMQSSVTSAEKHLGIRFGQRARPILIQLFSFYLGKYSGCVANAKFLAPFSAGKSLGPASTADFGQQQFGLYMFGPRYLRICCKRLLV